uniref:Uncharacterized protein n=1 Tax=Aegilops tauschii subsp. strangulata TaxID=200361 RepID=A0A452ZKF5_AEGTS
MSIHCPRCRCYWKHRLECHSASTGEGFGWGFYYREQFCSS